METPFERVPDFQLNWNIICIQVELYIVESSDIVKKHPVLHTIHFWTFSVLIKLIPCVVLTFFMCWMVNVSKKNYISPQFDFLLIFLPTWLDKVNCLFV